MKPGTVTIVSVNLDAITNPETILCPVVAGATMISFGNNLPGGCLGFKATRRGGGKEGNLNARWRRRMNRRKSARG